MVHRRGRRRPAATSRTAPRNSKHNLVETSVRRNSCSRILVTVVNLRALGESSENGTLACIKSHPGDNSYFYTLLRLQLIVRAVHELESSGQLILETAQTIDFGDRTLNGIVRTIDFGGYQLELFRQMILGDCLIKWNCPDN